MSADSIENALHHGWPEIEAEVIDCKYIHGSTGSHGGYGILAHYAVGFAYKADGIAYQGATTSSAEVRRHDKFAIRYNPEHPEENNSFASECDRPWFKDYLYLVSALIIGLMLYGFVQRHFLHR
jgi:hypothetical protein